MGQDDSAADIGKASEGKKYDVFGIGSALMDFLIEVDPGVLEEIDLKKGEMHLIDREKSNMLLEKISSYEIMTSPGGSSANTLAGIAMLGGRAVFCGKVGSDGNGQIYEQKSRDANVDTRLAKHPEEITGHVITFITPDSERTFATHLGAAIHLRPEDVLEDDVKSSRIVHVEGYQLEDPELRGISLDAMKTAHGSGALVSMDLADPGLVSRNREDLLDIVKDHADIVFANEEEAKALFETDDEMEALDKLSEICSIAIVKVGKKGSYIRSEGRTIKIDPFIVKAVDTTGAGDMYAAGVLYGISRGMSLEESGRLGSIASSKVVSQIGARLDPSIKDEIFDTLNA